MNHPCYLALTRFIDASEFKIPRSSVREALEKVEGVFDLSKLHEILSSFFLDLLVIQIDSQIDNHEYIITPCFLLRTEGNQFFIYVVLKIDQEKVTIFEHEKRDYTISTDEFHTLLRGSILIFKEEETYNPSKKMLKKYNEEQEEDKEYIKNIRVIDNFISEKECEKFINFCEESNLFQRSKVGSSSNAIVSNLRTSSTAFIEKHESSLIISGLKEKIAVFLGCNIHKIESLQVVRYYKSEGYKPHFDAFVKKRKLTCLLYLNEGFLGGETYFPEIGFSVSPKIGRLLIFQNLDENDKVITQSFHQGSPILDGVKYACNIWIES
jgi:hypothetical protein